MKMSYFEDKDISRFLINEINSNGFDKNDNNHNSIKCNFLFEIGASIASIAYIWLKNFRRYTYVKQGCRLAIARVPYGKSVLKKAVEDVFVLEDYGLSNHIIKYIPYKKRVKLYLRSLGLSVALFKSLHVFFENDNANIYKFYRMRIPHYSAFVCCLDELLSDYAYSILYSSQLIDRFAYAEYEIAKHYNIKKICIPHGLEPVDVEEAFPCDEMYCTSQYVADLFTKKYSGKKFIYDEKIIEKIYSRGHSLQKCNKIVFFSQGVNFADDTIIWLGVLKRYVENSDYYKSLIFKARYNSEDITIYKDYLDGIEVSYDIDDCLSSKVCISFFSTTLFEALYNNSYPIAIECSYLRKHPDFVLNKHPGIKKIENEIELIRILDEIAEK